MVFLQRFPPSNRSEEPGGRHSLSRPPQKEEPQAVRDRAWGVEEVPTRDFTGTLPAEPTCRSRGPRGQGLQVRRVILLSSWAESCWYCPGVSTVRFPVSSGLFWDASSLAGGGDTIPHILSLGRSIAWAGSGRRDRLPALGRHCARLLHTSSAPHWCV